MPHPHPPTRLKPTATASATIGFRLDDKSRDLLKRRAALLGVSVHELAREYVIETLHAAAERHQLHSALSELGDSIVRLRGDLATAVEALLIAAGEVDPKEARSYVERVFR